MKIKGSVTGIGTRNLKESLDFYTRYLGFRVIFENEWYVLLFAGEGERKVHVAFLLPGHPTQPPVFQSEFGGKGLFLQLDVEDADAEAERLRRAGIPLLTEPKSEPWGERHFAILDPNGVAINISHEIEMTPEFAALTQHHD